MPRRGSKNGWRIGLLAGALGASTAAVIAEDLYVRQDAVDVTEEPGALSDKVTTIPRNQKVQVLQRTDDGWAKIKTPDGKQGYVLADALAAKPDSGRSYEVTGTASGTKVSANLDLAARGLEPEAQAYSRDKHYDAAPLLHLQELEGYSKKNNDDWKQFCKDGHVGPYKSDVH